MKRGGGERERGQFGEFLSFIGFWRVFSCPVLTVIHTAKKSVRNLLIYIYTHTHIKLFYFIYITIRAATPKAKPRKKANLRSTGNYKLVNELKIQEIRFEIGTGILNNFNLLVFLT